MTKQERFDGYIKSTSLSVCPALLCAWAWDHHWVTAMTIALTLVAMTTGIAGVIWAVTIAESPHA